MRTHYIYKVTNKLNGRSYVGQTYDVRSRWWLHKRCRPEDDCYFHRALKRYGADNFTWEVIDTANSKEEANHKEIEYIKTLNTLRPNGYNTMTGGQGGCLWSARAVVCLDFDGNYITRYRSAGEAEKIGGFCNSDVLRCCKGLQSRVKNRMFMFEDDYKKFGAKKYQKPEPSGMKKIVQCDLSGNLIARFDSVKKAAEKTGILRSRISSAITGLSKTAGGYIFVYEEDFPIKDLSAHKWNVKGHKVAQVDPKTGEIVNVFDRMTDAARQFNGSHKFIHNVCDDPQKTAYGYRWISQ